MLGNGEVMFGIDFPWLAAYRPDDAALARFARPVRLLLSPETAWPLLALMAERLATAVRTQIIAVPGGHTAFFDRPEELAAHLRPHLAAIAGG